MNDKIWEKLLKNKATREEMREALWISYIMLSELYDECPEAYDRAVAIARKILVKKLL
ncbi:MAG: hypothetical protein GDA36_12810 [Rhodobacteraceae bacterium]|nr:hypothetical protein [Paracoccaceae bacterium]